MRIAYVSKTCVTRFTSSDAIHHVPLSLARKWRLVLVTGESSSVRGAVFQHLEQERVIPTGAQWSHRAFRALEELHRATPIDLVMTGIDEASLIPGWRAQSRLGIPWIAVCEDHPFQSRYDHPTFKGRLERAARTWFLRWALRRPNRLIYFIHSGVLDFLWIKDEIKAPLCNSADLETIVPLRDAAQREKLASEDTDSEVEAIAYVGLVNEPKGASYMLDVFRRVAAQRPRARLILIGRLDPAYAPTLEREIECNALEGKVVCTDQLEPTEALKRAAKCTVCIHAYKPLPWLYWNQVLKILEYMALGKAVVSVDYPGTRDLIQHGENGLLAPYDDPDAMADAIVKVLEDEPLRKRLEAGALRRADELSWDRTEEKLFKIVEECVQPRR